MSYKILQGFIKGLIIKKLQKVNKHVPGEPKYCRCISTNFNGDFFKLVSGFQ